ncbi:potassium transporter [Clavulina sp. PMI_390]|nr:potassium transporter [Clavulina sp. PMI_390]
MPTSLEDGLTTNPRRRPLTVTGYALFLMSAEALGVVFSDLGTSPVYTLNGIWPSNGGVPPAEDVIGGLSAIFWALTIIPLVKYARSCSISSCVTVTDMCSSISLVPVLFQFPTFQVLICLRFGTQEGEGGTFALFQGLYPQEADDEHADQASTDDRQSRRRSSSFLARAYWPLRIWTLFGSALTLSDGIFTPAVSVRSAVAGIAVVRQEIHKDIIPISIVIIVLLFLVQRVGTSRIAAVFAPITFLWLLLIGGAGISNITQYPGIFRAIDPSRAVMWFVRTQQFDNLAGVLLALTGSEVMFANLGQFNALSIQLSFSFCVYPCLILAYFGQGARLIHDKDAVLQNLFFMTIPGPQGGAFYWIMWVVCITTTAIASQTLITATFSLTQQMVAFKSLPPFYLIHTSDKMQGRIYVPAANWLLAGATIIVVAAFEDIATLKNAYGFSVSTVFIVTTSLIALHIYYLKNLSVYLSLAFFIFFFFFDGLFWGAALKKVPHGAWVPLTIGVALTIFMVFWTWARGLEERFDQETRRSLRRFLIFHQARQPFTLPPKESSSPPSPHSSHHSLAVPKTPSAATLSHIDVDVPPELHLRRISNARPGAAPAAVGNSLARRRDAILNGDAIHEENEDNLREGLMFLDDHTHAQLEIARVPTCAIFHKFSPGTSVPHAFYVFVKQLPAIPRLVIFLTVQLVNLAHVEPERKYKVQTVPSLEGFYGVTYSLGFRDTFDPSTSEIIDHIAALEARVHTAATAREVVAEIEYLAARTTHIIPHYHILSAEVAPGHWWSLSLNVVRQFLLETVYRSFSSMFPETDNWKLDNEDVLRVGVNAIV